MLFCSKPSEEFLNTMTVRQERKIYVYINRNNLSFPEVFNPLQIISLLGHKYFEKRIKVLNKTRWKWKSPKDMWYCCFHLWTMIFLKAQFENLPENEGWFCNLKAKSAIIVVAWTKSDCSYSFTRSTDLLHIIYNRKGILRKILIVNLKCINALQQHRFIIWGYLNSLRMP